MTIRDSDGGAVERPDLSPREALLGALTSLAGAATLAVLARILHHAVDAIAQEEAAAVGENSPPSVAEGPIPDPAIAVGAVDPASASAAACVEAVTEEEPPDIEPASTEAPAIEEPAVEPPVIEEPEPRTPKPPRRPAAAVPEGAWPEGGWLELREAVRREQRRRGLDRAALAAAVGMAAATTKTTMDRRATPSLPALAKFRAFVAEALAESGGDGMAPASDDTVAPEAPRHAPEEPGHAPGPPGDAPGPPGHASERPGHPSEPGPPPGHASEPGEPAPLSAEAVSALKRKRRLMPVTSSTLAGRIGVAVAELDAALTGGAIPPGAAETLQAWAAAAS